MANELIPTPPVAPSAQPIPHGAGPLSMWGTTALQGENPNALASNQMNDLMKSSSPLEQLAQSMGMNAAAARGSENGTLFAGASMAELNKNLQPLALANAQQEAQRVAQNADAINQQSRANTAAGATIASAGISANASMHNAQLAADVQKQSLQQSHDEFLTNWDNTFKQMTQSQEFQKMSQQQQNEFAAKMSSFNTTVQTIFSDPSYWADPQGAMGMLSYFNNNIDDLLKQLGISK